MIVLCYPSLKLVERYAWAPLPYIRIKEKDSIRSKYIWDVGKFLSILEVVQNAVTFIPIRKCAILFSVH